MKVKEGQFIRFDYDGFTTIGKVKKVYSENALGYFEWVLVEFDYEGKITTCELEGIISGNGKHADNLEDLLEINDIVHGIKVNSDGEKFKFEMTIKDELDLDQIKIMIDVWKQIKITAIELHENRQIQEVNHE